MSQRFYLPEALQTGQEYELPATETHHLTQVMRAKVGDAITVFDGRGNAFSAAIVEIQKRLVRVQLLGETHSTNRSPAPKLTIASALPKGDRFDFMLEKMVELQVDVFIPLICERSVVIPKEDKQDKWQRAIIEACKQCGRNELMQIERPCSVSALLQNARQGLVAHPYQAHSLNETSYDGNITIAIGPEGGFSDSEIRSFAEGKWQFIHLGSNILRIETGVLTVAAWHQIRTSNHPASNSLAPV